VKFESRLRKLEDAARPEPEDEYERQKRLMESNDVLDSPNPFPGAARQRGAD
jgi:hypothetical protein